MGIELNWIVHKILFIATKNKTWIESVYIIMNSRDKWKRASSLCKLNEDFKMENEQKKIYEIAKWLLTYPFFFIKKIISTISLFIH